MSIWDNHPNYNENELQLLMRATAETLADAGEGSNVPPDALDMSDKTAAEEIEKDLAAVAPGITSEAIRKLVRDPNASRQISLAILEEVRRQPPLAEAVDAAYRQHMRKLGDPALLLALAPIVLLALRIETVHLGIGSNRIKVVFGKSSEAVKSAVAALLSAIGGGVKGER